MRTLLLIALILNGFYSSAQGWDVDYGVYGTLNNENATDIELVNDSLYVFHTVSLDNSNSDIGVAKLSLSSGALEWTKLLGDSSLSRSQHVNNHIDVSDDGSKFICASNSTIYSGDSTLHFGELIMFDAHLDTLFTVLVGDSVNPYFFSQAKFMADGGFIAAGRRGVYQSGLYSYDMTIHRYNSVGEEQWNTSFSSAANSYDWAYSVLELSDGNILVGGSTRPYGTPLSQGTKPKLIRFSAEGQLLNDGVIYLPSNGSYIGSARISPISDEEVLIYLHKKDENDNAEFRIIRMTHDLYPVFDSIYMVSAFDGGLSQVKSTKDGGFITAGVYNSPETDPYVQYAELRKYNAEGHNEWIRRFNTADTTAGFNLNRFSDIKELPSSLGGGYVVCGSTNDNNSGQNYWVIRLDKDGCFALGCFDEIDRYIIEPTPAILGSLDFNIFPNPTSQVLNVFIPDGFTSEELRAVKVVITDLQGREIQTVFPNEQNVTLTINVGNLSNASYMISLFQGDVKLATEKFIVAPEE